jgi:hypothetical protein
LEDQEGGQRSAGTKGGETQALLQALREDRAAIDRLRGMVTRTDAARAASDSDRLGLCCNRFI